MPKSLCHPIEHCSTQEGPRGGDRLRAVTEFVCITPSQSMEAATSDQLPASWSRPRSSPPGGVCEGEVSATNWVRLMVLMRLHKLSGRLLVRRMDGLRVLYMIGGQPIHVTTTLPQETAAQTLAGSGLVSAEKVQWMQGRLTEGEDLEAAMVMMGAIDAQQRQAHQTFRLRMAVTAALRDTGAKWIFEASPRLNPERIQPSLLPDFEPLSALLSGSEQLVDINRVVMSLSQSGQGRLLPTESFEQCFPLFEVTENLQELPAALRESSNFEDLFRRMSVDLAPLVQLLWVLESAGLLQREGQEEQECSIRTELLSAWRARPAPRSAAPSSSRSGSKAPPARSPSPQATRPGSSPSSSSSSTRSSAQAPTSRIKSSRTSRARSRVRNSISRTAILRMVATDHDYRMGKNPFVFLGVPEDADDEMVSRAAARLARRWREAKNDESLPEETRTRAGELVGGVGNALKLLGDEHRRANYLRRRALSGDLLISPGGVKEGPPVSTARAEPQPAATTPAPQAFERGQALMEEGDYRSARAYLEQARMEEPSSPEVLAALGWTTWMQGGARVAGDAEDYLRLALTFDGRSIPALTALSKVLLAQDKGEQARPVLKRLIRLQSSATWARRALSELGDPAGERRKS